MIPMIRPQAGVVNVPLQRSYFAPGIAPYLLQVCYCAWWRGVWIQDGYYRNCRMFRIQYGFHLPIGWDLFGQPTCLVELTFDIDNFLITTCYPLGTDSGKILIT